MDWVELLELEDTFLKNKKKPPTTCVVEAHLIRGL